MPSAQDAPSEASGDIAAPKQHYEVWASTPTHATIVGGAHTLLGALTLYLQARKAAKRDHTINLLVNARSRSGARSAIDRADRCGC